MKPNNPNYKQLYTQLKEINDVVQQIDNNTIEKIGDDFFQTMVNSLSNVLKADVVFIAELVEQQTVADTLYVSRTGKKSNNIRYNLKGTPCINIISNNICLYPNNVQELFPKDLLLTQMSINAYAGIAIPSKNPNSDGEWALIVLSKKPIQNQGYYEHILNICAQKIKAEKDRTELLAVIQEREVQYRDLFDNANDPIAILDNKGRILKHNRAFSTLTGYSKEDLKSLSLKEFVHPDELIKVIKKRQVLQVKGSFEHLETRIIQKNGAVAWIQVNSSAIYDSTGKIIGSRDVARNITKQKLLEEQLAKANEAEFAKLYQQQRLISQQLANTSEELNRFFELSVDMLIILDKNGIPQRISPSFIRAIGYSEQEFKALPPFATTHPDDIEIAKNSFERILKGEVVTSFVVRILTKEKNIRWFSWSSIQDPQSLKVCTVAHDITDRIQLEEELRQAKEEAIRNAKIKENFLANMSHEIRTPMNAILGFSELLLQTNLSTNQEDYSNAIYSSAENLLVVINDILDLSKIESGKFELDKFNFDFHQKIQTISTIFKINTTQKKLNYIVDIDPSIPTYMYGSPNRIIQVLMNLLSNAVKFTHQGFVKLIIKKVAHKEELLFEIIDSGIGISSEKLDYIFENFTQAEDYTTRVYGGTGLGLSISQKLVNLMGGQLDVRSELGKGSTFFFTIPFKAGRAPLFQKTAIAATKTSPQKKQLKILAVDDNILNRKLIAAHLKLFNYTFDLATNGQEALDLAKANSYDLILMDIQMPIMDGLQATAQIRAINKTIPIIAITAHALKREKQKCIEIGMNDYLAKPFRKEELHELLIKYVGYASPTQEITYTASAVDTNDHISPREQLDSSKLLKDFGGDEAMVKEILVLFDEGVKEFLVVLQKALKTEDLPAIRKIAHRIKPNFELFRLVTIKKQLAKIEQLVDNNGAASEIYSYCNAVLAKIPDIQSQITAELNK